MNKMDVYLTWMTKEQASDLYLAAGRPPIIKVQGKHMYYGDKLLAPEEILEMALEICTEEQKEEFLSTHELNLAYSVKGYGRYRVNFFQQRGTVAVVARYVRHEIPTVRDLGLPNTLNEISLLKQGLVLITGPTGSGKTTTLAAMVDYRNSNSVGHIITIEDPIEFVHRHKKSIVTQREVGIDTESFIEALRNVVRQAPDVVLIGEMRDVESVQAAIHFAETGHLVLATLHANTTEQALERILNFYPTSGAEQVLVQLSIELAAIIGLRLVQRADGTGRCAAYEIMLATPRIREIIERGQLGEIKTTVAASTAEGCITFDQCLYDLYKHDVITEQEALRWADSANNLRLKIKMEKTAATGTPDSAARLRLTRTD
jgi:twitching motility protein PilU